MGKKLLTKEQVIEAYNDLAMQSLGREVDIANDAVLADTLAVGLAGQHYVCFYLMSLGFMCTLSHEGSPHDVIVDVGKRLRRIQVKTVSHPVLHTSKDDKRVIYDFRFRSGNQRNKKNHVHESVDIIACVGLKDRQVDFLIPQDVKTCWQPLTTSVGRTRAVSVGANGKSFVRGYRHTSRIGDHTFFGALARLAETGK